MSDDLWDADRLATYLGLSRATVLTLSSRAPNSLPPRVKMLRSPRWVPDVVRDWVVKHSIAEKGRGGRPRG